MSEWPVIPLLEVCRAYQPKTIGRKDMVDGGPYPVYGANGVIGNYHSYNHADSEVLLGCRGSCGSVNVSVPQSWVTGNSMVIKPRDNRLSKEFLRYFLDGSKDIAKTITGVAQPQITQKSLAPVLIPLPPLEEQLRIVTVLDGAFAAIATAAASVQQNLANGRALFAGFVAEAFGNESWPSQSLGEVAQVIMGQSPPGDTYNASGIGMPLINGPVEFGGNDPFARTVATKFTSQVTKTCQEGDAIVCVRGSTTGRMNLAGQDACIGRGVAAVRSETDQEWINQFLRFSQDAIYRLGSGATFPNVSSDDLKKLKVPLPPPELREKLLSKLQATDGLVSRFVVVNDRKLALLAKLKQSLLHRAFSGQLTQRELVLA